MSTYMNWQWLLANGNGFQCFQQCCSLYVLGILLVFVACIVCAVAHIRSTPLWQPCEKVAANVAYDEFNCLPRHLRQITLEKLVDYIE